MIIVLENKNINMNPYGTFYGGTTPHKGKKTSGVSPVKQKLSHKKVGVKLPSVRQPCLPESSRYSFGQLLGEGAFSKVYLGKKLSDNARCVIKIYEKSRISTEERKRGLKRQIQALTLTEHKNLAKAIDTYENDEHIGIIMEYFSEVSLAQFVSGNRPIENSALQNITKQLCEGLIHLHSFGMAHRDIKPENILIDKENRIKIIDFGFSTTQDQEKVVVAGTPQYMAPELINKKNYDPMKADIWALGIMLYWLATGFFPQGADPRKKKTTKKIETDFELYFPVSINPGLEYLLRKMLKHNPKERIGLEQILQDTWIKPKSLKAEIDRLRQSKNLPTLIQFY